MSNNRAAILLASYNGEKYIRQQLESIINQSYKDFMCYIRDDGSTDGTIDIIESFVKAYPDHFTLVNTNCKNHGSKYNFYELIQYLLYNCEEEYIFFSDQDDFWLYNKIEVEVGKLRNTPGLTLAYCAQEVVNENLVTIGHPLKPTKINYNDHPNSLTYRNVAAGCTMCVTRELLQKAFLNISPDKIIMHDWWLMLFAAYFGTIVYVEEPLMKYRQHGNNVLGVDNNNYIRKIAKYLSNFTISITKKKRQTHLCKAQMYQLLRMAPNDTRLLQYAEIMKKNKISKEINLVRKKYIESDNLFTCLFV